MCIVVYQIDVSMYCRKACICCIWSCQPVVLVAQARQMVVSTIKLDNKLLPLKGVKIYLCNRRDIRQSSYNDAQTQEPIVSPSNLTRVPVISTPDPVIKTVTTLAPPVPSQEGGESKACKHDKVPVNKPVGTSVEKPVVKPSSSSTHLLERGERLKYPPGICKLLPAAFDQNICMLTVTLAKT